LQTERGLEKIVTKQHYNRQHKKRKRVNREALVQPVLNIVCHKATLQLTSQSERGGSTLQDSVLLRALHSLLRSALKREAAGNQ
jgi:hypothetical protein